MIQQNVVEFTKFLREVKVLFCLFDLFQVLSSYNHKPESVFLEMCVIEL